MNTKPLDTVSIIEPIAKLSGAVLIADDDDDVRPVVRDTLQGIGLTTFEAKDGKEALEIFDSEEPHLLIVDGRMPTMTGLEVCQAVRKKRGADVLPIIMLTAMERLEDKVAALEQGANDYLTKPFHYKELQARVRVLLRVRDLNVRLAEKNAQLQEVQDILLQQERQLVVSQLAGTAAHQLGQPLSAILLNCYLLQTLSPNDAGFQKAIAAIEADARSMSTMIERLQTVDAAKTEAYFGNSQILDID